MSNYRDLSTDFPARCLEVYDAALPAAVENGREITLLLMALSAALLVPLDRLRHGHPSGEGSRLDDVSRSLEAELGKAFSKSAFGSSENESWGYAELRAGDERVEGWPDHYVTTDCVKKRPAGQLIRCIRNSLAHGNTYAEGDPIEAVVFISERRSRGNGLERRPAVLDGYQLIRASPADLRGLLGRWCSFLQAKGIAQRDAATVLAAA